MSYQIITRITITSDLRVMVRMAANNIRPLDFRYDEVVSLTETLRTKGRRFFSRAFGRAEPAMTGLSVTRC